MSVNVLTSVSEYKSLVDHFDLPVVIFDDQLHLIYQNRQFSENFGNAKLHLSQLIANTGPISPSTLQQHVEKFGFWRGHVVELHSGNRQRFQLRVIQFPKSQALRFVGIFEADDSENSDASTKTAIDALTGLPNRYAFFQALSHRIQSALTHNKTKLAVLYIDLDHFKDINELHGHTTGDELLCYCAAKMRALLRRDDLLARLAGDEFAALVECEAHSEMQYLCQRILRLFEQSVVIDDRHHQFTVSIGVAFFPKHGCKPDELLIHSEKAMFLAKRLGRAQFQFFDRHQSEQVEHQQRLAESLRMELSYHPEQFRAAYQPLYTIQTGECIGMEVLARWSSPEFGDVSPVEFIPLAEARGLINALSARLFDVVLNDISNGGVVPVRDKKPLIAVNVSAQQILSAEFEKVLLTFFEQVTMLGWQLEVELTESQLMSQTDALIGRLSSWRSKGIRIAIDDFGTGYSCLAYLHLLPVDKLKIDRQFLQAQTASRNEDQIMYAIMSMANALGIEVLAEGIETGDQFQRLIELGCESGQGYGLAKPQAWSASLMNELWEM